MRAKDIKTGDWVAYDGHNVKVTSVSQQLCILKGEQLTYSVAPKGICGIRLTEDILERNGWAFDQSQRCWALAIDERDGVFLKAIPYDDGSAYDNTSYFIDKEVDYERVLLNDIHYVHELQHLLWALGLDDKMKV